MDISLQYEIEYTAPLEEDWERDKFHEALDQIELADELGFHAVWAVEHHFLPKFSHSSAPEVWLAAAADRTDDIRIGQGVVVLPYWHPVQVAERSATLDIISDGRVELGTGRSVTQEELGGFKIPPSESMPRYEESLEVLPKLFEDGPVSFEGEYWEMGEREVLPKPVQKPHPPMYRAGTQPKSWRETGEAGLGMLGFTLGADPEALGRRVEEYEAGLEEAEPVAKEVNDRIAVASLGLCAPTDEIAKERFQEAVVYYMDRSFEFYTDWGDAMLEGDSSEVPDSYEWYAEASQNTKKMAERMKYDTLQEEQMILSGSPETLIEGLTELEDQGIDEVMFLMQVGSVPHEHIVESIELIADEVMPAL